MVVTLEELGKRLLFPFITIEVQLSSLIQYNPKCRDLQ